MEITVMLRGPRGEEAPCACTSIRLPPWTNGSRLWTPHRHAPKRCGAWSNRLFERYTKRLGDRAFTSCRGDVLESACTLDGHRRPALNYGAASKPGSVRPLAAV